MTQTCVPHSFVFVILAFFALLPGVTAEMDTDLIGVIVACVCIGVLMCVIIAITSYCCFRRIDNQRRSILSRKDSGSESTNGISTRWAPTMVPSTMPVYSVPRETPRMYALPPPNYVLGYYTPKFVDAERIEYLPHMAYQRDVEEEHARRSKERESTEHVQPTPPRVVLTEATPQPNGNVVHDFSATSANYKVIRKQHKHEKMPEWLRKSYGENERSLVLEEEGGSKGSSVRSAHRSSLPPTPQQAVRAQVSPHNSTLDSNDVLNVSPDFTIVDYVDPELYQRAQSDEFRITTATAPMTTMTTTTTTRYSGVVFQQQGGDVSHASVSTFVPPASTSTPRAPPMMEGEEDEEGDHYRMRRAGEGSVHMLPADAARVDVPF